MGISLGMNAETTRMRPDIELDVDWRTRLSGTCAVKGAVPGSNWTARKIEVGCTWLSPCRLTATAISRM
jgi:hypothetical protein